MHTKHVPARVTARLMKREIDFFQAIGISERPFRRVKFACLNARQRRIDNRNYRRELRAECRFLTDDTF